MSLRAVPPSAAADDGLPKLERAHIYRTQLPWRDDPPLTECGKDPGELKEVITRAAAIDRIKRYGEQRAAFVLCMTCVNTARNHKPWEQDPVAAIAREAGQLRWRDDAAHRRFTLELQAIAALIEAHRDEFNGYLTGVGETISLGEARRRARVVRQQTRGRGRS